MTISNEQYSTPKTLESILGEGKQKDVFVNDVLAKLKGVVSLRLRQCYSISGEHDKLDILAVYEDGAAFTQQGGPINPLCEKYKKYYLYQNGGQFFYQLFEHKEQKTQS